MYEVQFASKQRYFILERILYKAGIMILVEPSVEIVSGFELSGIEILKKLERVGRVCYKSEDSITDDSCVRFVKNLIKNGHDAIIEHHSITFKLVTNRGVTHELVRHRIASYAQESSRYCNYNKKGVTFLNTMFFKDDYMGSIWVNHMKQCEAVYNKLINAGAKPEEAREVLPNSLKTEIVCTMNLRELRHLFKLRTSKFAHPEIRRVMELLLVELVSKIPVVFDDIYEEVIGNKIA